MVKKHQKGTCLAHWSLLLLKRLVSKKSVRMMRCTAAAANCPSLIQKHNTAGHWPWNLYANACKYKLLKNKVAQNMHCLCLCQESVANRLTLSLLPNKLPKYSNLLQCLLQEILHCQKTLAKLQNHLKSSLAKKCCTALCVCVCCCKTCF